MEYSSDLFILSGGIHGEIVDGLSQYKYPEAKKVAMKLYKDFMENFYIEVPAAMRLETVRKSLFEMIKETGINYIVNNDVYYPENGEAILQKILSSIKEGNKIEADSYEILYDDLYLKSYDQMKQNFSNFEDELFSKGIENINYIIEENLDYYKNNLDLSYIN